MSTSTFFDETTEQSQVKAAIVAKYFNAWAQVIIPTAKQRGSNIAYIDLFAGPGRYKDGSKSTPLIILETAIKHLDMRKMLVTVFNDKNENNSLSLVQAINELEGINLLTHKPKVYNDEIGSGIVNQLSNVSIIPSLCFVDPWGYKGLSLQLVNAVLKDWGCDCIFFFNYNRINMGLANDYVRDHMDALFGSERANILRDKLTGLSPHEREVTIIEEMVYALKDGKDRFILPFRFKSASGARTSHHLFFVSKHFKGYEIMKNIMAKESTTSEQGVPSFEYNAVTKNQPFLFELSRPLDELGEMLLSHFSGRTLTMKEIYLQHNIDRPYIKKNYKETLISLEKQGKIIAVPPSSQRRKDTFADHVRVTFPS